MIERPDPDALMAGPLGAWLNSQNEARAAVKAKVRKVRIIGVCAAVALFVAVLLFGGEGDTALKLGGGVGLLGFAVGEAVKRPMLNKLKGGINGAIAQALGLDYSVECTPGQTFERAKTFQLVPGYDDSSFQDLWWGVLGTSPFTLHEACLTEQRGSGKSRRTVTVFQGSIMSLGFNRAFTSTTVIEPNGERTRLFGGEKDSVTIGGIEMGRVDMVDPRFEDRFTVWSNDQVEARYLVHPEYIERLIAVEQAFAGTDIRALFHGGDLLIALKSGDLFESGSLEADKDRALLEQSIAQFGALADLAIKLNERARMRMRDVAGGR